MDSDDDSHLDRLRLAALHAGAAASPYETAHLAWCASCRAALADIHRAAAELPAAASATGAMPDDGERLNLSAATESAARLRRRSLRTRARWAALAAAAVVAVGAAVRLSRVAPSEPASPVQLAQPLHPGVAVNRAFDADGDGRVTVLDAYTVARSGAGDQTVVDRIMVAAVSLGER